MMLRESSRARGDTVELQSIVVGRDVDSQVPGSAELIRLVDAALTDPTDLAEARAAVTASLGTPALIDAAGVIGNFQRMVRIADSTGIPVDGAMAEMTTDLRAELGLNELPSARLGS